MTRIKFEIVSLEFEVEMFTDFLDQNWRQGIFKKYPEFSDISKIKSKKERLLAIKNEVSVLQDKYKDQLASGLKEIKSNWQKIEKNVFSTLVSIIQETWPDREITAQISLNPVCPRFLDSWSFFVTFDSKCANLIIAHEISHFLFFQKLKNEFPEIKRKNYEAPHREWILSEIITPIILNDPRIFALTGSRAGYYQNHKALQVEGKPLTELIENLYTEYVLNKNDFNLFIKKCLEIKINYI